MTGKAEAGHIAGVCLDILGQVGTVWMSCFSDAQEAECDVCGFEGRIL